MDMLWHNVQCKDFYTMSVCSLPYACCHEVSVLEFSHPCCVHHSNFQIFLPTLWLYLFKTSCVCIPSPFYFRMSIALTRYIVAEQSCAQRRSLRLRFILIFYSKLEIACGAAIHSLLKSSGFLAAGLNISGCWFGCLKTKNLITTTKHFYILFLVLHQRYFL